MGKRRLDPRKAFKAVGLTVRRLRESRGWTLEDMEGEGDISWQQIQKIETGRNITMLTLIRLANILDVHPTKLLENVH